jgi:Inner membrane component domain
LPDSGRGRPTAAIWTPICTRCRQLNELRADSAPGRPAPKCRKRIGVRTIKAWLRRVRSSLPQEVGTVYEYDRPMSGQADALFEAPCARPGSAIPAGNKFPRLLKGPCNRNSAAGTRVVQKFAPSQKSPPSSHSTARTSPIFDLAFATWRCVHNASAMLSVVKTIGNNLWFCVAGLWLSISYAFAAVIMTLLVVTAPFGIASWRLATYVIWPFGRSVVSRPGAGAASTIGNILWFVLAGLWIAIGHVISSVLTRH